jgi:hypothetical protein
MEITDQSFNIVDIKPANMEELTEVSSLTKYCSTTSLQYLKRARHEVFDFRFFHESVSPYCSTTSLQYLKRARHEVFDFRLFS